MAETVAVRGKGPELETGGTNNLTTTAHRFSPQSGRVGAGVASFESLRTPLSHVDGRFAVRNRK
jgi:hypothetical protein